MKIVVLGAGAWGTAVAVALCERHDVVLCARDATQALAMQSSRVNQRYLDGVVLPRRLSVVDALAMPEASLFIIATPMSGLRDALRRMPDGTDVAWLCKGFEQGSGLLAHEVAAEVKPGHAACVVSGPSFADEVARARPTALVAASADAPLRERVADALRSDALRVYTSADAVGVEVGGAVKNVLAIATGLCDGLGASMGDVPMSPGLNARAALVTRGLAEMSRLGVALGAEAATFMGLSGLGDLVLTATGALSRNRRVGLLLAQGLALPQVLAQLGHVAEGVATAPVVLQRAQRMGIEMPITEAVVAVLEGRLTPLQGVHALMRRDPRAENP